VLIRSYNQPHSIVNTKPRSGEKIELTGEVFHVDDDPVAAGRLDLGIPVKRSAVRLVTSHGAEA
jgi:hypothetical protein